MLPAIAVFISFVYSSICSETSLPSQVSALIRPHLPGGAAFEAGRPVNDFHVSAASAFSPGWAPSGQRQRRAESGQHRESGRRLSASCWAISSNTLWS